MQPTVTSGCIFSQTRSNYAPNMLAACLHLTLGIELCPFYLKIHHVSLLSNSDTYPFFQPFVKTHMAVWHLQFLVSNYKAATGSSQMFLQPRFSLLLLSASYRQWYWVAPAEEFKHPTWYSTTNVQTNQCIHCIIQNKRIWMHRQTTFYRTRPVPSTCSAHPFHLNLRCLPSRPYYKAAF